MTKTAHVSGLVAVLALGLAGPAGAGVSSGTNAKFCRTLQTLSEETGLGPDTGTVDQQEAEITAKALRKAAKKAPKAVKKALKTLAVAYERIADGESLVDVINEDGTEIAAATTKYGIWYLEHCFAGTTTTTTTTTTPG
jgi:hypothetical protein